MLPLVPAGCRLQAGDVDPPLHELEPTTRFSSRAREYARFRPDYPSAALDCILTGLGDPASLTAADVGAGTGISARLLAERAVRVHAVEPNAEMRAAAEPHPRIAWHEGTAESTGLPAASVDLVLCAQAFHWFRQPEAVAEFHRILRIRGRLALMWNGRDRDDPFTRGYIEAIHAVHGEHPAERSELDPAVVGKGERFGAPVRNVFSHAQRLDREGLRGRALSASYVPRDETAFAELARRLEALYERHRDENGMVTLRYRTEVWLAERW
jgi:SAM-dependent methyltransferase